MVMKITNVSRLKPLDIGNVKLPLEREGSIRFYVCSKISKREGNNEKLLPKRVSAQAVIFHYYRSA